jgi:hypothetical protein
MNSSTKSVAVGEKRWARLFGASTAWSLGGWALLIGIVALWLRLR